jgi:uncharacterized protein (TIGR02246 family)
MNQNATTVSAAVAERYSAAWAARDSDAIAALHTPDTLFHVHGQFEPVRGRDAVRAAAAALFERWPGFAARNDALLLGERHWVLDWTLTAENLPQGVRLVDVVELVDRLVARKDTFLAAGPR